jgi:hypothetical protein
MAVMAIEPLLAAAGGEAAAGGGAAAAEGGGMGGLASKFGGQALTSKIMGGGHKGGEQEGHKPSLMQTLTAPGLGVHVSQNYGSILQGGQFG